MGGGRGGPIIGLAPAPLYPPARHHRRSLPENALQRRYKLNTNSNALAGPLVGTFPGPFPRGSLLTSIAFANTGTLLFGCSATVMMLLSAGAVVLTVLTL